MRRFRAEDQEAGFGLILVIGMSMALLVLVMLGATIADRSLISSNGHVTFEQSLAAAESGIDQTISRLQRAYVLYGVDFPVPGNASAADPAPSCSGDPTGYMAPAGGFADDAAERTWARQKLLALLAANPSCLKHSSLGDYIVLKPSNRQVVYSMGFAPSYGAAHMKTRLVKSEYLFQPYKPTNAILTGGNLTLDSSTLVTTAPGSDPSLASVHSNGSITVENGNPTVYGTVSSSQPSTGQSSNNFYANPGGGAVATTPKQPVPAVSARAVYTKWSQSMHAQWYNLCPDGKVTAPVDSSGAAVPPCDSTAVLLANLGPGGPDAGTLFRGFRWLAPATSGQAPQWLVNKNVPDGVYYAVGSDIVPDTGAGNTVTSTATIIAQAVDTTVCQKVGGNISWDHNNISTAMIPNLFMLADADLVTSSNFSAGSAGPPVVSGMFVAGDQVQMQTSSNGAYGAVVAADECPPTAGEKNEIKNPSLYYDPTGEAPFTDVINTTLWLEYVG